MKKKSVNIRTPQVMSLVTEKVQEHYRSEWVSALRQNDGILDVANTRIILAKEFGFCYGVQRAIDLAYAACEVFPDQQIYLIGEIIHNPEVNRQLSDLGVKRLPWQQLTEEYEHLTENDVVLVPAFGAPTDFMNKLHEKGVNVVDTTCGDVMKVWRRVKEYAQKGITAIIHGKFSHEETRATASRALGKGNGKYVVIFSEDDCQLLCDIITGKKDVSLFAERLGNASSPGFDPIKDLMEIGIANQTTMLKSETESIQNKLRSAIIERDGSDERFQVFDTICGATQERQNALFSLLKEPLDALFVVGGYNSSNTTHLVEIAEKEVPTFFISTSNCLKNVEEIIHFDIHQKTEIAYATHKFGDLNRRLIVGITAGASCPDILVEETILRILTLRGVNLDEVKKSLFPLK